MRVETMRVVRVGDEAVEALDEPRFRAVLELADRVAGPGQGFPQLRRVARGEPVDPDEFLAELHTLALKAAPSPLAGVIGHLRRATLIARARAER
jgi:hypothetical protein